MPCAQAEFFPFLFIHHPSTTCAGYQVNPLADNNIPLAFSKLYIHKSHPFNQVAHSSMKILKELACNRSMDDKCASKSSIFLVFRRCRYIKFESPRRSPDGRVTYGNFPFGAEKTVPCSQCGPCGWIQWRRHRGRFPCGGEFRIL